MAMALRLSTRELASCPRCCPSATEPIRMAQRALASAQSEYQRSALWFDGLEAFTRTSSPSTSK